MRYFIGFLVTIALIILLIVLLVTHHGGKAPVPAPLISYAGTSTVVRETIDGRVNDTASHRQVQITVGSDHTTFELLSGYDGQVINTQDYPMTPNAYAVFLASLQHAGYLKGDTSSSAVKDERGYCPLGRRYIFEIIQNGNDIQRFWTTDCSGTPNTFKGSTSLVTQLFQRQVPDYDQQTNDVTL